MTNRLKIRNMLAGILTLALVAGSMFPNSVTVSVFGKKSPVISKKKITITATTKKIISIKNINKKGKVTWKLSNKKYAVIVKKAKKGTKASATVKGKKKGKVKLTATYKYSKTKKKFTCNIVVAAKKKATTNAPANVPTGNPVITNPPVDATSEPGVVMNLFDANNAAPIIIDSKYKDEQAHEQIERVVTDLRQDISMVTGAIDYKKIQQTFCDDTDREINRIKEASNNNPGKVPELITASEDMSVSGLKCNTAIIVGSVNESAIIGKLIKDGKLNEANEIKGKWEAYIIKSVKNPIEGVDNALVIAGSDTRGTIYGVYTVSEAIGVSPFYWYSDVPVEVKDRIDFDATKTCVNNGPTVKYRGIFINDEEKSTEWANEKYKNEDGTYGPGVNYYRKVFELILRLKSNTLWPAMHDCSAAFNLETDKDGIPINSKEASKYGVIMGSSHCEILLRNNVGEWYGWFDKNRNDPGVQYPNDGWNAYDFTINKELLLKYWRERLQTNKNFESIFTIGIRDIHDSGFKCRDLDKYEGDTEMEKKVSLMKDVISSQRALIAEVYGEENVNKIPQVFIPYNEVNDIYNAGLDEFLCWDGSKDFNEDGVIDYKDDNSDIMLMWAEDNENYLRQDISETEAKRKGGAGIYYHISYWGPPASWLWLNSTSMYVMSEQMHRGYNIGADDYWILNIGDIKPSEPSMEYFLKMSWDPKSFDDTTVVDYLTEQAKRDYGLNDENAEKMAGAVSDYYMLNGIRKAEFYVKPEWGNIPRSFDAYGNGDEALRMIDKAHNIVNTMDEIYEAVDDRYKDAFFEQLYYNAQALEGVIENVLYYEKNRQAAAQGRFVSATAYKELSMAAKDKVLDITQQYSELNDGKWDGFIDVYHPGKEHQFIGEANETYGRVDKPSEGVGVACENYTKAGDGTLRFTSIIDDEERYFDVFNKNAIAQKWCLDTDETFINVSAYKGEVSSEERIKVSVDFDELGDEKAEGHIFIYNADDNYNQVGNAVAVITVTADNTKDHLLDEENDEYKKGYIEADGYVSIEAENYSEMIPGKDGSYFGVIKSEGLTTDTMKALPDTAKVTNDYANTAKLVYNVYFDEAGTYPFSMKRRLVLNEGSEDGVKRTMNIAVGVNDGTPTVLKGNTVSNQFDTILSMCETLRCDIKVNQGWNQIVLYRVDASFVWDKMYIETVKGAVTESVIWPEISPNTLGVSTRCEIGTIPKAVKEHVIDVMLVANDMRNYVMEPNAIITVEPGFIATNGTDITYSVNLSDNTLVEYSVNGDKLKFTSSGKGGTVLVTVTAKAAGCDDVSRTFYLVVKDPNIGSLYVNDGDLTINATDAVNNSVYAWCETYREEEWVMTENGNGLKLIPDNDVSWSDTSDLSKAPTVNFRVNIKQSGNYRLQVNMSNPNDKADSYHLLVDGKYVHTLWEGSLVGDNLWAGNEKEFALSAGEHTITIAAREDGFVLNKIRIYK